MPEWLYNIEQIIGMPALIGGLMAGITILFLPGQNSFFRISGSVFVGFSLLFIVLRISSDWILINWGLGVPYWGESAFSDNNLMKFSESQREIRMTVHSVMWTLTFRVFPVVFLLFGGMLAVLSFFQKQKWKGIQIILSCAFLLFACFFLLTLIEQTIGIKGNIKG